MFASLKNFVSSSLNAHYRKLDIEFLWPVFKKQASNIEYAKHGFMCHILQDPAWEKLTTKEIDKIVDDLN